MTVVALLLVVLGQTPAASTARSIAAAPSTVSGRVLGRDKLPVAGVSVFQSGHSTEKSASVTDGEGQFKLDGVDVRPTFLVARKAGYRAGGVAVTSESKDITVTIHKTDEPPVVARKTLPPLLPREEELALARRVIDTYAELVLKQGGEAEKVRTLEALARIEPERVLELIEKKVFNQPLDRLEW
jgi:hypothetical protein